MKNRRGFNPDARVKDAAFAFRVLSDSVFTKGFLGPSLREDSGLPSVGVSSARRAGVIVDDNGKMRCPPGTPNANQFTDINMSNCMVPSAETVARNAAEVAAQLASRAADGFKRGTHKDEKKDRDLIPKAGVGFANADGFLEQRTVRKGVSVVSPRDGSQRQLNELEDSIDHVAQGGDLSDIPDEHLVRAILANAVSDKENKPEVRFQIFGSGGGMHGMKRMKDTKTGALIGVKYDGGSSKTDNEAIAEVASELVLEHFGYEPTPMRLVPDIGQFDWGGESWNGLALVTELAHNRHDGDIESGRMAERDYKYEYNVDPSDVVRMAILDSIIQNTDRHEGNFMIAKGKDGKGKIVPIDHSRGLSYKENAEDAESIVRAPWGTGLDEALMPYWDDADREKLLADVAEVQKLLAEIDSVKLQQSFEQLFSFLGGIGSAADQNQKDSINAVFARIAILSNPEVKGIISEKILPEWKRPNPPVASLDDFVSRGTVA